MKKIKKEVSTTGGVAGYDGVIPAVGNPTEKEVNQWKKKKKLLNILERKPIQLKK